MVWNRGVVETMQCFACFGGPSGGLAVSSRVSRWSKNLDLKGLQQTESMATCADMFWKICEPSDWKVG